MTFEEELKYMEEWLKPLYSIIKRKIGGYWDDDVFQNTILYLCSRKSGVNHLEDCIYSKYRQLLTDKLRFMYKERKYKSLIGDFTTIVDDKEINSFADSLESESDDEEVCRNEVNLLKKLDLVKDILGTAFSEEDIEIYFNYIINYKDKKVKGKVLGLRGISLVYGISRFHLNKKIKAIQNFLNDNKTLIIERYEEVKYPSLDEYTLLNIIE